MNVSNNQSKRPDSTSATTECCYLDGDNDIFMREQHGRSYRYYPRENFPDSSTATNHIGRKPGMDRGRVGTMCRIAFGESTPAQEGLTQGDVYRTLEQLGQN